MGTYEPGFGMVSISTKCPMCGRNSEVTVPIEQFQRRMAGMHIQEAYPTLTSNEREQLLTGTCNTCWELLAPPDEEEW